MLEQMTYDEAVELLSSSLKFGIDASLEPIRAMCASMGNPQNDYKCVQHCCMERDIESGCIHRLIS